MMASNCYRGKKTTTNKQKTVLSINDLLHSMSRVVKVFVPDKIVNATVV